MLAPYRERVAVVDRGTDKEVDCDVDLVLYDTFGAADHAVNGVRGLARQTGAPVVVFSWTTDRELVRKALDAGAAGFLPKTLLPEQLVVRLEQIQRRVEEGAAHAGARGARARGALRPR